MAGYPGSEDERRVDYAALRDVVARTFAACGMSDADAGLLAETLAVADLRGVHSHGTLRVPDYVAKLTVDGVDPRGTPRVARDAGAAIVIDGGNSMGQIGGAFAMRLAIERARDLNVAVATVGGSNHCGAMAYFAMQALPHDMIGIATTNALPTMAPWGGAEKIVGINPIAVAIPAATADPVVFDAAFSGSSHGKIRVYHQKGLALPDGWAFDADGRPTTDTGAALDGLLQPIGGYKGISLAMIMGLLSSLLSGAGYGTESGNMVDGATPGRDGHFFMAINVAGFEDVDTFKRRVDGVVAEVHDSRRAPGVERLFVPGELEAETERLYRRDGIPLNDETLSAITGAAADLGVDAGALTASIA